MVHYQCLVTLQRFRDTARESVFNSGMDVRWRTTEQEGTLVERDINVAEQQHLVIIGSQKVALSVQSALGGTSALEKGSVDLFNFFFHARDQLLVLRDQQM
jgi:hypothetical protein